VQDEYTDIDKFAELLKPGYAYRLFIDDGNPDNKTVHVRAVVDDRVVYAVWSQPKQTWRYRVDRLRLWMDWHNLGWLTAVGKTGKLLPEIGRPQFKLTINHDFEPIEFAILDPVYEWTPGGSLTVTSINPNITGEETEKEW
jgi:hypothetical protein